MLTKKKKKEEEREREENPWVSSIITSFFVNHIYIYIYTHTHIHCVCVNWVMKEQKSIIYQYKHVLTFMLMKMHVDFHNIFKLVNLVVNAYLELN